MSNSISWDDHRYFLAVIEAGSFSGAARNLGVSHPTVKARIDALEARLQTTLFVRSGSGLVPTEVARELQGPSQAMADAAHQFVRHAYSSHKEVAGRVRISVPEVVGIEVMPSMLRSMRQKHAELTIELCLSNKTANLLANDVDLAVRTVAPAQEALVVRKAATISLGLFASGEYLARKGVPASLEELKSHDFVGPDRGRAEWAIAGVLDLDETSPGFVLRTDSHPAQVAAARAGLGIAAVQVPLGNADHNLARVLPDLVLHSFDTWIVAHENTLRIPRVRAVFDHLVEAYKSYMTTPPMQSSCARPLGVLDPV